MQIKLNPLWFKASAKSMEFKDRLLVFRKGLITSNVDANNVLQGEGHEKNHRIVVYGWFVVNQGWQEEDQKGAKGAYRKNLND